MNSAVSNSQQEYDNETINSLTKETYLGKLHDVFDEENIDNGLAVFNKAFSLGKQEGELKRLKEWLSVLNAEKVMFVADIMAEINAIEKEMKKE